jgi:hypothetical protein
VKSIDPIEVSVIRAAPESGVATSDAAAVPVPLEAATDPAVPLVAEPASRAVAFTATKVEAVGFEVKTAFRVTSSSASIVVTVPTV